MRIGVDLGGTKIEAVALDDTGRERARRRVSTPAGDYAATVAAVRDLVRAIEAETGQTGSVGVGIPGVVSPLTGLVKNANSVCLIGHPLDRDLTQALGRPVRLANDANCFAVSEAVDGAAADAASVFGVILGTGVGGGLVANGQLLTGANAIAGEWGHNPLPWPEDDERPGPACYCGKHGCIETFLSGPGLERDHRARSGDARTAPDIARADTPSTRASLERYVRRLAKSLATVINLFDPEVIVLGGGLSNLDALYAEVPKLWQDWTFSDRVVTRLVRNRHGDASGVRGAAWLWPR